ncbi:hypothetical protein [Rhizobium sp. 18065]|uniref:hypothetical protein n=1 Tax=Rhizobium sp. 18065 TaxID=2681411 RepID=UPI00190F1D65|nr:hypothetical protein [Rhizobium sp. 18065]
MNNKTAATAAWISKEIPKPPPKRRHRIDLASTIERYLATIGAETMVKVGYAGNSDGEHSTKNPASPPGFENQDLRRI